MELKTLTWKDFEKYDPCYDPQELYGDWQGTIIDLLNRYDIPAEDKIWATSHILDDKTLRLFAVCCARDVAHLIKDKRILNALDVAERYAMGHATDDELDAARDAARAAAKDAVGDAARTAAWATARATAKASAWDAAGIAAKASARAAAGVAAKAAARAAARDAQIKRLILMIQNA